MPITVFFEGQFKDVKYYSLCSIQTTKDKQVFFL